MTDFAAEPVDMRAGADRLLMRVVQVFGAAKAHHGYLVGPEQLVFTRAVALMTELTPT